VLTRIVPFCVIANAGRGALDVKVSVVGLLEAAAALLESGYSPRRTLLLAFGHDEEVGGTAGAARIAGEPLVRDSSWCTAGVQLALAVHQQCKWH
jgi:hypothetical protein